MKLLNQRYFGLIARCNACGAIIGYSPEDVSATQNISCPQCRFSIWVPLNPTYDGIVKEEGKEKDGKESMV